MNLRRIILLSIMSVLAFATANAKIASWDITSKYEKLNRYYNDIYAFQQNGKWGLVQSGNKEILPASYDFITPIVNDYALFGSKEGSKCRLGGIIGANGIITIINEPYYLSVSRQHDYAFFSEDKLVVYNQKGRYGYIDPTGGIVIRCQFDDALPFNDGWAPVLRGNYFRFINDKYEQNKDNVLSVDFHYGDMTEASCFSNGYAVVAYNDDFAVINTEGVKIKKIKKDEFDRLFTNNNTSLSSLVKGYSETSLYNVITKNGKCGLKDGDAIILLPQFDLFPAQYDDGAILTVVNGKYGILKISESDISISTTVDELDVDRKGNVSPVQINCNIPVSSSATKLSLDLGDGIFVDLSDKLSNNGGTSAIMVTPIIANNAESCIIKGFVESDGIKLTEFEKSFSVNYPVRLRVSAPGPSSIRANKDDMATFSSTVFNDSNKQVTVTATWSTGKTVILTIPAHSSRTTSDSVYVPSKFSKNISLVLSSGDKSHSTINFEPFF